LSDIKYAYDRRSYADMIYFLNGVWTQKRKHFHILLFRNNSHLYTLTNKNVDRPITVKSYNREDKIRNEPHKGTKEPDAT
jgi:hypothetical protein